MFMSAWENLGEKHPRLEVWIDTGLAYARKYYGQMDHTRAYILAMGNIYYSAHLTVALTRHTYSTVLNLSI